MASIKRKRLLLGCSQARVLSLAAAGLVVFVPFVAPQSVRAASVAAVVAQNKVITGVVTDPDGEPIIGASITDLNQLGVGTITDAKGHFKLNVPAGTTIQVSFVGFTAQVFKVKDGTSTYNVTLREDQQSLNEVVVVGYGVQKKANLTGAVASINAEALANRPVSSVSAALAGTMPGVTSIQRSGEPGAQTGSITIRGRNTINAASPLVIVDGVPGSMNNIDPQDIESLSVLKDAASAAIYGVQAANGVILITTKRGKAGQKTRVDYTGMVSNASPTTHLKFLGSADYAMLYNEATRNENPSERVRYSDEDIRKFRDGSDPIGHPDTDWYRETFKRSAWETQHNLSLSGGTQTTTYMGSVGFVNQAGLTDARKYKRFTGRLNLDSRVSKWLSIGLSASAYRGITDDAYESSAALVQYVNRIAPTIPIYNEDGGFNYSGLANPVALRGTATGLTKIYDTQFFGTVYAEVRPLAGLSLKALYNLRHDVRDYRRFKKHLVYGNSSSLANSGDREGEHNYYNWNWYTTQLLANYTKTFAKLHTLNALLGCEQVNNPYSYTKTKRKGGGSDELPCSLNTLDAKSQTNDDGGSELARRSYFGRLQYDFADKYLFEFNLRADASSLFPKDNRWGYFPAVSAAWRLSEEAFLKRQATWLSNLKLRLGWGKTGNEEINETYPAVATYAFGKAVLGDTETTTTYEARYVNNKLRWATVTNYELGLDASFFDNQVGFELSLYQKNTDNMLLKLPIQGVIGVNPPAQNAGSVRNTGFDLNVFHNYRLGKDLRYAVNLNLSYVHNKITDLKGTDGENPDNKLYWFMEGQAIGTFYGYVADGYFNTQAELDNGPKRTGAEKLGDIRYKDFDGDNKITAADRKPIGKNFPSWTGGLNLAVYYKDFDFSMLWQGAFDVDAYFRFEAAYAFFNSGKVLKRHLDRWTPTHHDATYPRITRNSQINFATSSFWLQDASYVRLKNVTLGYTIPRAFLSKWGVTGAHVFLTGENLLTFSHLEGLDPEAPSDNRGAFYSNVKKFTLGLKVSF